MNGEIAQLVAIACHFNACARGRQPSGFFPGNSTCQFCEYVRFSSTPLPPDGGERVDDWLHRNARPDRAALLTYGPKAGTDEDRLLAGFVGGGGVWRLNVIADAGRDAWKAIWTARERKSADRRNWRVNYVRADEHQAALTPAFGEPELLIPDLGDILDRLISFCRGRQLSAFQDRFGEARECLSARDPFSALVYHKDLAPEALLALPAQQLLAACEKAWVFGGMGSWNDIVVEWEAQAEYESLSRDLFAQLHGGIIAAANSTATRPSD